MLPRSVIALSSLALGLSASSVAAEGLIPSGQCAVIVASRPSVSEARQLILTRGWSDDAQLFLSGNGWYAITLGSLPIEASRGVLRAAKQAGDIPGDSYCSTGGSYIRQVDWRAPAAKAPGESAAEDLLYEPFSSARLTASERRMLQSILAVRGDYNGLIDGDWGPRSAAALRSAIDRSFDGNGPFVWQVASMFLDFVGRIDAQGWQMRPVDRLSVALWFPEAEVQLRTSSAVHEEWAAPDDSRFVTFAELTGGELAAFHGRLLDDPVSSVSPYVVRGETTWITSVQGRHVTSYIRSDLIASRWSTVAIFLDAALQGEMALMSGSIQPGRGVDVIPPETGYMMRGLEAYLALLADLDTAKQTPAPLSDGESGRAFGDGLSGGAPISGRKGRAEPEPPEPRGSGTAFYVTGEGTALTNAHVVESCSRLTMDGAPASVLAVSRTFDLAALQRDDAGPTGLLRFAPEDARLNADITIAGYPLHGLLGGLNVGRGSVSSLKGLGGDETTLQISAPVQPGNSGGPMIDRFGNVVGVVVAKLDTRAVEALTGDIAQNVNFAVRGSIAKIFLAANDIPYQAGRLAEPLAPEDAARRLQEATVLVECH